MLGSLKLLGGKRQWRTEPIGSTLLQVLTATVCDGSQTLPQSLLPGCQIVPKTASAYGGHLTCAKALDELCDSISGSRFVDSLFTSMPSCGGNGMEQTINGLNAAL